MQLKHGHIGKQRRRLVLNIGGAKIWVTNIGGQEFRENIFWDNILKFKKKHPSIL